MTTTFRARAGRRTREQTLVQRAVLHPLHAHPPWLILLLCLCAGNAVLLIEPAIAQTEWKDRPVTLAPGDQTGHSIARPARSAYTVVVWEDKRAGEYDIYAQMIDSATGLPVWGDVDGMPVCTAPGDQRHPRAAYDTLGGVIIVWEDHRDAYENNGHPWNVYIHANRLELSDGSVSPQWDPTLSGVVVCGVQPGGENGSGRDPQIVGTGEGAYIAWTDYRIATASPAPYWRYVYAQYLLSSTASPPPSWTPNGNRVDINGDDEINPEIALDNVWRSYPGQPSVDALGLVVVYQDNRHNLSPGKYLLSAAGIGRDGNALWVPVVVDRSVLSTQRHHRVHSTGGVPGGINADGAASLGTVVVWEDNRLNPSGTRTGIYVQVLHPDFGAGVLGTTEVAAHVDSTFQHPALTVCDRAAPDHTEAVLVWEKDSQDPLTGLDVYVTTLDVTAGVLRSPVSEPLSLAVGDQEGLALDLHRPLQQQPHAIVGWVDHRLQTADIYYQDIALTTFSYERDMHGWPVTQAHADQQPLDVGGTVFVFGDARRDPLVDDATDDWNISCQKPGVECDLPTRMAWRDVHVGWRANSFMSHARGVTDLEGSQYLVWDAYMDGYPSGVRSVFIQKVDAQGVPRWQNNGVLLSDPSADAASPDVCIDGSGGVYVVWQQGATWSEQVHVARVTADGQIAWSGPVAIQGRTMTPRVAERYTCSSTPPLHTYDGCIVVLHDWSSQEIAGITYAPDGTPTLLPNPIAASEFLNPMLQSNGDDGGVLLYSTSTDVTLGEVTDAKIEIISSTLVQAEPSYGYALSVDPCTRVSFVAYIDDSQARDVRVHRYDAQAQYATFIILTDNSPSGWTASNPAIVIDSIPESSQMGALVAWDVRYPLAGSPPTWRHMVSANRVLMTSATQLVALLAPGSAPVFGTGNTEETHPTIAIHRNADERFTGSLPPVRRATIAWSDDENGTCVPDRALMVQQFDFADATVAPQPLFGSIGQEASPSLRSRVQTDPFALSALDEDIALFWLDWTPAHVSVMGTHLRAESGQVRWAKPHASDAQNRTTPSSCDLSITPHPFVLSRHADAVVRFTLQATGPVQCTVHDLLGRTLQTLVDQSLSAGSHAVPVDIRRGGSMPPSGVYFLRLTQGGMSYTLPIVLQR